MTYWCPSRVSDTFLLFGGRCGYAVIKPITSINDHYLNLAHFKMFDFFGFQPMQFQVRPKNIFWKMIIFENNQNLIEIMSKCMQHHENSQILHFLNFFFKHTSAVLPMPTVSQTTPPLSGPCTIPGFSCMTCGSCSILIMRCSDLFWNLYNGSLKHAGGSVISPSFGSVGT